MKYWPLVLLIMLMSSCAKTTPDGSVNRIYNVDQRAGDCEGAPPGASCGYNIINFYVGQAELLGGDSTTEAMGETLFKPEVPISVPISGLPGK